MGFVFSGFCNMPLSVVERMVDLKWVGRRVQVVPGIRMERVLAFNVTTI